MPEINREGDGTGKYARVRELPLPSRGAMPRSDGIRGESW